MNAIILTCVRWSPAPLDNFGLLRRRGLAAAGE
jgi:hypothetical protein